jgi:hypothetical protein
MREEHLPELLRDVGAEAFLDDPMRLHRMATVALNRAHEAANARDTEGVPLVVPRRLAPEHASLSTLLN